MSRIRLITFVVLLVGVAPAGAAAGERAPVPEWAVECLPRIADWAYAPPASSYFAPEYTNSYPGVYGQTCYYWSTGDARGAIIVGLSWVTAEADPDDIPLRTHCTGIGEYTNESETRGIDGGIVSDTHRASVSWDGDAGLPDPPNEARHASAEMLLTLEEVAAPCAPGSLVEDGPDAGAVPAAAPLGGETGSEGGIPPAAILVGGAAAAAAAGAGVRRVRARRRVPSLGDLLAADQIRQGMIFGGGSPIEGGYHLPPELTERFDGARPSPDADSPSPDPEPRQPDQSGFDELAREGFTAKMLEAHMPEWSVHPFEVRADAEAAAERFHEKRRRRGRNEDR